MTLYDNHELRIESNLLTGLVQALMMLGEEMGPVKGSLREAELGKYQISILSRDHLAYVAIHDAYDSEPFTRQILNQVISKYHQDFVHTNFNIGLRKELVIKDRVSKMLQTMKFPESKINQVREEFSEFISGAVAFVDTLFLADLDDGIITIHTQQEEDDTIIKLLMEILSEIPFERQWIGQSKLKAPVKINDSTYDHELWLIFRVEDTDYCVMGRAYYQNTEHRDAITEKLEEMTTNVSDIILT